MITDYKKEYAIINYKNNKITITYQDGTKQTESINHMNHVFDVVLFIIYLLLQDEQKILIFCVAYLRTVVRILYLTCRLLVAYRF